LLGLAAPILLALNAAGCARQLTIEVDDYINTAVHWNRDKSERTGEPLEVAIVCVTKDDLKNEANGRLDPESGITSDVWFTDRPIPGDKQDMEGRGSRFWLPKTKVFTLTDDRNCFGTWKGERLQGAVHAKRKEFKKTFDFDGDYHDDKSVIYVFAKFIGPNGELLKVAPAKFHPPGAYTSALVVRIGVDENRQNYGQYIEIDAKRCPRKMHGKE